MLLPSCYTSYVSFLINIGPTLFRPHKFLCCQHVGIFLKLVHEHLFGSHVVAIEIFDEFGH